ncbi:hypothetical protein ACFE04_028528 [Oxalis oulophora]
MSLVGEKRGARLLEELKTSRIFYRESRGWTSAIVVKRRKGVSRGGTSVVAKEKNKQAEKSVEREAVATDNEMNLADNGSSWAFPGYQNVEQSSLPEILSGAGPENLSGAAPGNLSREATEHLSEAELETGQYEVAITTNCSDKQCQVDITTNWFVKCSDKQCQVNIAAHSS